MLNHRTSIVSLASLACTALCFLIVGCSGSSGTSEYEEFKKKEAGLADKIVAAGGTAKKEGRSLGMGKPQGAGWFIDLHGAKISDEVIEAINVIFTTDGMVFDLNLGGSNITDDQLGKLASANIFRNVFILNLSDTGITDAGLDKIQTVYCLAELNLKGSKATKDGAKRLGERKVKDKNTPDILRTAPKVTI